MGEGQRSPRTFSCQPTLPVPKEESVIIFAFENQGPLPGSAQFVGTASASLLKRLSD